jgi:hypothetical protein
MDFASIDPSLEHYKLPPATRDKNPFTKLYYAFLREPAGVLDALPGSIIAMPPTLDLLAPTKGQLYVFPQYTYLTKRLDAFWLNCAQYDFPPAVAIVGTPGIGSFSSLFDSHAHPF